MFTILCAASLCAQIDPADLRLPVASAPKRQPPLTALARRDGSVHFLEEDLRPYRRLWPGGEVTQLRLSDRGEYLGALLKDGKAVVWTVRDLRVHLAIPVPRGVLMRVYDDELVILGKGKSRVVQIWCLKTRALKLARQ